MTLRQPDRAIECLLEEKRSQFHSYLIPLTCESEVKAHIQRLRQLHPKASHVCSAFRLEAAGEQLVEGFSDDGEPSGTAGMPMLKVLRHQNCANALIAIARYFGGTKLGMGGLQRAYGQSAANTLIELEQLKGWQEIIAQSQLRFDLSFQQEQEIHHWCRLNQASIIDSQYHNDGVTVTIELPASISQSARQQAVHQRWKDLNSD